MEHYPPRFKTVAVALYETLPGVTVRSGAAEMGAIRRRCGAGFEALATRCGRVLAAEGCASC